jgi:hypothetical protein
MIQSTLGMSNPRAATSVQSKTPVDAAQKALKVRDRSCWLISPCNLYNFVRMIAAKETT